MFTGIRRLQLCLLKVALTVGVDVQLGVTYKGLRLPKTPLGNVGIKTPI